MTQSCDAPTRLRSALRLHLSENTGGCSRRVVDALRLLTAEDIASYPAPVAAVQRCAEHFGVPPDHLVLTNGLDEGILTLAIAALRSASGDGGFDAIVAEPAFDVFRTAVRVAGGRLVQVAPSDDFTFPLDRVLNALTDRTRLVIIANPNNPTGVPVPLDAIRTVARRVPPAAVVFVDEAYAEFAGRTLVPEIGELPNVIVGRSFSKAYGLAGLRLGCLIASPRLLEPIREVIPIYSVNTVAAVAIEAALSDREHVESYVREVETSKALLYAACEELRWRCWRSASNFVLVSIGVRVDEFVSFAAARGIHVRNRSTEPGCAGCIRVTAGRVADTQELIRTMTAFESRSQPSARP